MRKLSQRELTPTETAPESQKEQVRIMPEATEEKPSIYNLDPGGYSTATHFFIPIHYYANTGKVYQSFAWYKSPERAQDIAESNLNSLPKALRDTKKENRIKAGFMPVKKIEKPIHTGVLD